jgi:adenylate cyclase
LISGFRIRDLVGPRNLVSLIARRYHKPVREDRVSLFVDLVGSTGYAWRHGDPKALALLARAFATIGGPVRRYAGEIDDHAGDMAVVTWQLERGIHEVGIVRCFFAFLDEIEREADTLP